MNLRDKQILRIALPSIVSNITVPLLGLVDVAITGHLGSAAYIGAIAVGGMLFNIIYWMFAFLRMGTSGMTSQALGARNLTEVVNVLLRAIFVSLAISALMLCLQVPVRELSLSFIAPSAEVAAYTRIYFNICIWGAVPALGLFAMNGWYIGMQNSRFPMIVAIAQNLLNIVCSIVFVYVLGMRIEGVALGTLLAQWVAFAFALVLCLKYYGRLWRRESFRMPPFGRLLRQALAPRSTSNRQNFSLFLRTLCLIVVHFMFIAAGAAQGSVELAVNTLLMQMFTIFSYFMDGFAYAGEALVGKSIGAANSELCRTVVRRLFQWGGVVALFFVVLYALGGEWFMSFLTDDAQVLEAVSRYRHWTLLLPLCGVASFLWDGVYIGATSSRLMLLSMAISMVLFLTGYFLLIPLYDNHGLWVAFLSYLACRGMVQTLTYRKILP